MALSRKQRDELPSTVARSDQHAQATWAKTHDSAAETYGEGERAHRTAFSALKHGYEKVGDHWEPKQEKGPSDDAAARRGDRNPGPPAGGGVARARPTHHRELAKRLDVAGRSRMTKDELVEALQKANDRHTAKARN